MDVTIKDVPEEVVEEVKEIAMHVIEGFLRKRDLKVEKEVEDKLKSDVDVIRQANNLDTKYDVKIKEVPEVISK